MNRNFKISLIVNSSNLYEDSTNRINHLKQILNIKQQINLEIQTPPESPNFVINLIKI